MYNNLRLDKLGILIATPSSSPGINPHGTVPDLQDCDMVVNEFELQSRH